jgi:ribose 5-phosphate isomerase A
MGDQERLKRAAAERAVEFVESGMRLGLGTGSTARHVVDVLAERLKGGSLRGVEGVATSRATADQARALGVPLTSLDEATRLDVTIDGADEVDPALDLMKGLGGALLWEKIVASASDRLVIVVDEGKLVSRLGERAPVPVEVVPFGWRSHLAALRDAGAVPELRRNGGGEPFVSDGGHYIVDCRFDGGVPDPAAFEALLRGRIGIVGSGLFLGMATDVVVAGAASTRVLTRGVHT